MSTLVEIESAVANLPPQEQRSLLEWLQGHLLCNRTGPPFSSEGRKQWLAELASLRARGVRKESGTAIQQIMDEIRDDRF